MSKPAITSPTIPWYRTRWFWGVIIGALVVWGLGYYTLEIYQPGHSLIRIFADLSLSLGALSLGILLDNMLGESFSTLLYYLLTIFLLYMTFRRERVVIIYPLIFTTVFLLGHIFGILYIAFV